MRNLLIQLNKSELELLNYALRKSIVDAAFEAADERDDDNHGNGYCLDRCGRALHTRHEVVGGICWHCLSEDSASFSEGEIDLWETETTAPYEDDDGIDEDEKLCMLINRGLASIWPSPQFDQNGKEL